MLNDEQVQKLRLALSTAGWNDVIRPLVANRGRQAVRALTYSRSERAKNYAGTDFDTDDDVLRAMIRDAEWMASVWYNEVNVAEHNRQLEELERRQSDASGANP